MDSRTRRIFAVLIFLGGPALATDFTPVTIHVKPDGQMCELLSQITECSEIRHVLAQEFGVDRNIPLTVTPEGCGEAVMADIRVIVNKLRSAGYTRVTVAGKLSKPNSRCTP